MRDIRPEADPRRLLFGSVCAAVAILVVLVGCSGGSRDRDPAEILVADAARNSASPAGPQLTPSLNIGDVEALVRLSLKAPAEQFPPTAEVEPMETRKGHLAAWYVTLKPPHPKSINVTLDITVMRDFSERPVVLELELLRDDQPTGITWRTMISRQFIPAGTEVPDGPRSFQADMLQGLTELPSSVLAVVRARAALTPKGTDPAALDWEHFDMNSVPPEDRSVMYSNPVRVTFENGS